MRVYDTNTTNLTSVFSDAALAVPLVNPVVADSSGITPQVFAAEGTVVDYAFLTAAGAAVPGRTYVAVSFLGADTTGSLPVQAGNAGKFVTTNGTVASWAALTSADLTDSAAFLARAIAFAVAL